MELNTLTIFIIFTVAFVISLAVTPLAIIIAPKIGAIDVPKDGRRMHKQAIPRFGGMAIYVATMVTLIMFGDNHGKLIPVMIGGTAIYILGIVDDFKNLSAKFKFGLEFLIATIMYAMGLRINLITNYFGEGSIVFGTTLCYIITVLWIVGITNTVNLVDGLDGLAAGIATIASVCIAYIAYIHGSQYGMMTVCLAMVALAGATSGFLPYNFFPAKIFMGDGGSLFLGFMIATLSVVGPLKQSTVIAVVAPIIVLGVPIFDTFFAIVRRLASGRPIMEADRGHLHHRLIDSGYGQKRAVIMLYGISGIMGMSAVLVSRELYKDAMVLILIACAYIYVFLTDPATRTKRIKAVNIAAEEKKAKKTKK